MAEEDGNKPDVLIDENEIADAINPKVEQLPAGAIPPAGAKIRAYRTR